MMTMALTSVIHPNGLDDPRADKVAVAPRNTTPSSANTSHRAIGRFMGSSYVGAPSRRGPRPSKWRQRRRELRIGLAGYRKIGEEPSCGPTVRQYGPGTA